MSTNPFQFLRPAPYVSQHVGLPLEEMRYALEKKGHQYQTNLNTIDEISMMVDNFEGSDLDESAQEVIGAAKDEFNRTVEELSNQEFGAANAKTRGVLRSELKRITGNPALKKVTENYQRAQQFDTLKQELAAKGQLLDHSPRSFKSVTYDEDGNPQYHTLDNPYSVKLEWGDKKTKLLDTFLREELMAQGVDYKDLDDLMSKPFVEIYKTAEINPKQLEEKLEGVYQLYLDSAEGRQELKDILYQNPDFSKARAEAEIILSIWDIGEMKTYSDTQRSFSQNSLFGKNFETNSGGLYQTPTETYNRRADLQKPTEKILDIAWNENPEENPEEVVIKERLLEHAFSNPKVQDQLTETINELTTWSEEAGGEPNDYWLPRLLINISSVDPALKQGLHQFVSKLKEAKKGEGDIYLQDKYKDVFPEEFALYTYNTENGTKTDWFGLRNHLIENTEQPSPDYESFSSVATLADASRGSIPEGSTRGRSIEDYKTLQEKNNYVTLLDGLIRETAKKTTYKAPIEGEEATAITGTGYGIDRGTPEGRKVATNVDATFKQTATESNMIFDFHQGLGADFDPDKFTAMSETAEVLATKLIDNELYFRVNIKGKYRSEDVKNHTVYVTFDDNTRMHNILNRFPTAARDRLQSTLSTRGMTFHEGRDYYTSRSGDKVKYPEGISIRPVENEEGQSVYAAYKNGKPVTDADGNTPYTQRADLPILVAAIEMNFPKPKSTKSETSADIGASEEDTPPVVVPRPTQQEIKRRSPAEELPVVSPEDKAQTKQDIQSTKQEIDQRLSTMSNFADDLRNPSQSASRNSLRNPVSTPFDPVTTPEPEKVTNNPDEINSKVINQYKDLLGKEYSQKNRLSGDAYDCSSLVCKVIGYDNDKAQLSAADIYYGSTTVNSREADLTDVKEAKEGTLVFFGDTTGKKLKREGDIGHVGIIVEDKNTGNKYIFEAASGKGVILSPLAERMSEIKYHKLYLAEPKNGIKL